MENQEEQGERSRLRGRGSDADRAAGSSAQGGVWVLLADQIKPRF